MQNVRKNSAFLPSVLVAGCILIFVADPTKYMQSVTNGLSVWAAAVVPALFPFFVLSKLLVELDFFGRFEKFVAPVTQKLFKAPAAAGYIFLTSIVSGYPVGAKLIQEYHRKGLLTQTQCKKIATFTSTSGPLFVLGTVGGKFFGNATLGFVLLGCHLASAVICGLLFRGFYCDNSAPADKQTKSANKNILDECIYSSVSGILTVGAFIALFYMLTDMIFSSYLVQHMLSFAPTYSPAIKGFLTGMFEVTRGCAEIAALGMPMTAATVLCGTLISFGGICIMMQSYVYLKDCGVKFRQLFAIKAVQAAVCALLTFCVCLIVFGNMP